MVECTAPGCDKHAGGGRDSCVLLNAAYVLAGLAMMLNIRLSYSSAPYALIRFKLPENLFSVFVRRMASSLELWCLPGFVIADIMDLTVKGLYNDTFFQKTVNQLKKKAGDLKNKASNLYGAAESLRSEAAKTTIPPSPLKDLETPAQTLRDKAGNSSGNGLYGAAESLESHPDGTGGDLKTKAKAVKEHYGKVKSAYDKVVEQKDKYTLGQGKDEYEKVVAAWKKFNDKYHDAISTEKFHYTVIPSIICQWLNFLTYVILLIVYVTGGDSGHLTVFYFVIAISGVVFGINMTLVYAVDWQYTTVYIAGENCFPILTSFIHYITTLIFGNRRKYNSDFIVVCVDIVVAIIISLAAAVVWTLGYAIYVGGPGGEYGHIHAGGFGDATAKTHVASPFLMIVVGMGLVYAIYPGIAPGMIVPFYLIDKIEMVLLVATIFPPMIVVILQKVAKTHSPKAYGGWNGNLSYWHFVDLLMVIKITLAYIFIYSLHYRDSTISRSIVNQPKMSTFLSITFYMCHEFLLAIGFAGQISNGAEYVLIPQYIGALFMIFLAFYSEGYIIEYKSHDPAH